MAGRVKALTARPLTRRQAARAAAGIQRIRARMERRLAAGYSALYAGLRRALASCRSEADIVAVWSAYTEDRRAMLTRYYTVLYPSISEMAVPADTAKSEEEDLDAYMRAWIEERVGEAIGDMSAGQLARIRALYRTAGGDSVAFMDLLREEHVVDAVAARRIAVTETTAGLNQCLERTSRTYAAGRTLYKTWRTTGRLNVRRTHEMMDGVTIPDTELFRVPSPSGGIDLMAYPGDASHGASAGNLVNCHCVCFRSYRE